MSFVKPERVGLGKMLPLQVIAIAEVEVHAMKRKWLFTLVLLIPSAVRPAPSTVLAGSGKGRQAGEASATGKTLVRF